MRGFFYLRQTFSLLCFDSFILRENMSSPLQSYCCQFYNEWGALNILIQACWGAEIKSQCVFSCDVQYLYFFLSFENFVSVL